MPELILVRHARTAWSGSRYCGRSDPPLDGPGLVAADRLGADLGSALLNTTRIVTSPLRRALQTAEAIARHTRGGHIAVDPRWSEIDFGMAEGLTFEQLERVAPDIAAALAAGQVEIDWPGGETSAGFAARIEAAWHDVAARRGTVVVVSHGGPLRLAIALATGRPAASVSVPEPGGVVRLALAGSRPRPPLATTA